MGLKEMGWDVAALWSLLAWSSLLKLFLEVPLTSGQSCTGSLLGPKRALLLLLQMDLGGLMRRVPNHHHEASFPLGIRMGILCILDWAGGEELVSGSLVPVHKAQRNWSWNLLQSGD